MSERLPQYLNGPEFVEWLEWRVGKRMVTDDVLGPVRMRRIREYRKPGKAAEVGAVDKILVALGIVLAEVPADLFVEQMNYASPRRRPGGRRKGSNFTADERRTAISLYETDGLGPDEIAKRIGATAQTIRRWIRHEQTGTAQQASNAST